MNHNFKIGDEVIIINPVLADLFSKSKPLTIAEIDIAVKSEFNILIQNSTGLSYWLSSYDIEPAVESNSIAVPVTAITETAIYTETLPFPEYLNKDEIDALLTTAESTHTPLIPKGYMIFVENQSRPKHIHSTYEKAVTEAHRLAKQSQNINYKVYILAVLSAVVGTVSVDEVDL